MDKVVEKFNKIIKTFHKKLVKKLFKIKTNFKIPRLIILNFM